MMVIKWGWQHGGGRYFRLLCEEGMMVHHSHQKQGRGCIQARAEPMDWSWIKRRIVQRIVGWMQALFFCKEVGSSSEVGYCPSVAPAVWSMTQVIFMQEKEQHWSIVDNGHRDQTGAQWTGIVGIGICLETPLEYTISQWLSWQGDEQSMAGKTYSVHKGGLDRCLHGSQSGKLQHTMLKYDHALSYPKCPSRCSRHYGTSLKTLQCQWSIAWSTII